MSSSLSSPRLFLCIINLGGLFTRRRRFLLWLLFAWLAIGVRCLDRANAIFVLCEEKSEFESSFFSRSFAVSAFGSLRFCQTPLVRLAHCVSAASLFGCALTVSRPKCESEVVHAEGEGSCCGQPAHTARSPRAPHNGRSSQKSPDERAQDAGTVDIDGETSRPLAIGPWTRARGRADQRNFARFGWRTSGQRPAACKRPASAVAAGPFRSSRARRATFDPSTTMVIFELLSAECGQTSSTRLDCLFTPLIVCADSARLRGLAP